MELNISPWLEDSDTGKIIYSERLHVYLNEWKFMVEHGYKKDDYDDKEKLWKLIKKKLDITRNMLTGTLEKFQEFLEERSRSGEE